MIMLSLKFAYRNMRYILALGFSVILTVSLFVGANLAVTQTLSYAYLKKIYSSPADFIGSKMVITTSEIPNLNEMKKDIFSLTFVTGVEVAWTNMLLVKLSRIYPNGTKSVLRSAIAESTSESTKVNLAGVPSDFGQNISEITWIQGGLKTSISNNSIAISEDFAETNNLGINDTIEITYSKYSNGKIISNAVNLTISGIYKLSTRLRDLLSFKHDFPDYPTIIFLMPFQTCSYVLYKLDVIDVIQARGEDNFKVFIFANKEDFVFTWSYERTAQKIKQAENKLNLVLGKYGLSVSTLLLRHSYLVMVFQIQVNVAIGFFVTYLVILAFLASILIFQIFVAQHRKILGKLLATGATYKQIRYILLTMNLVVGFISGICATFLSSVVDYYIVTTFVSEWYKATDTISPISNITIDTFITSLTFSLLLMIFVTFFVSRNIAKHTPRFFINARDTDYREEQKSFVQQRRTLIFLLFILSLLRIVSFFFNFKLSSYLFEYGDLIGHNFILYMLATVALLFESILFYIGHFIFVYTALVIFLIYYYEKSSRFFRGILKIMGGQLHKTFSSGLHGRIKSYITFGLIIGIVTASGASAVIMYTSRIDFNMRMIKSEYGADINISTEISNPKMCSELANIEGINNYTLIYYTIALNKIISTGGTDFYGFGRIIAIDPEAYLAVARNYIESDYSQNGLINSLKLMEQNDTYAMVSSYTLSRISKKIGDNLWLSEKAHPLIIDKVFILPGMGHELWNDLVENIVVVNINFLNRTGLLQQYTGVYKKILVDVSDKYNASEVAKEIKDTFSFVESITVTSEEYNTIFADPQNAIIIDFYRIEYIFLAIEGVFIFIVATFYFVMERQKEIGLLLVRGATVLQILRNIITELFIVCTISLILGLFAGVGLGFGYTHLYNQFNIYRLPYQIIIPLHQLLLISFVSFAAPLLGSMVALYIVTKQKLRNLLTHE